MPFKMQSTKIFLFIKIFLILTVIGIGIYYGNNFYRHYVREKDILKKMVERLKADSRAAEVIVTDVKFNPMIKRHMTTIKFLEYSSDGKPLTPRYFTFSNNIIQFQSLVVRFEDTFVLAGDRLKGRSVYLFWKAFVLDGARTEEYVITSADEVPDGYKVDAPRNDFEEELWRDFWEYALDADKALTGGIKNAQIEAPGMKFVPGMIYTLKIEHDGGIRIDAQPIPAVFNGESL